VVSEQVVSEQVLSVAELTVGFRSQSGEITTVVKGCGFELGACRILGLAGESGCGKSTAALSAIGFPIPGSVRLAGSARLGETELFSLPRGQLRRLWGREIAYVAQDASQSLSPLMRVERLLAEPLRFHLGLRGEELRARSIELLTDVGIPDPQVSLRRFPHEFSGGQQQRIALAIAMACRPRVLVLDEPTTGLDVTTQAQIATLIARLVRESGAGALMISHDLALLGMLCDDLAIMYAGEIVERGPARALYGSPRHPYTAALIDAMPRVDESTLRVGIPGLPPPRVIDDACAFAARCRFVGAACRLDHPSLRAVAADREVRCLRADELGVITPQRGLAEGRQRELAEALLLAADDQGAAAS
jgi:peptide/nickel transport system ATP-binding protein